MLLVSVFFLLMPHAFSLNFIFTSFQQEDDRISLEKSARLVGKSIDLVTPYNDSVGRATYHQPMHLWDKATGKVTDFTTKFTFVIDSRYNTKFGDGMAFFFAPKGSKLPNIPKVGGGGMGLITGGEETMLNSIDHPFVAVEFDIFSNGWDPRKVHVGVNINSMKSITTMPWWANIKGGRRNEATISYNATTHNLSISFTGYDHSNKTMRQHLYYIVDLTRYMPEWVTFGFSAATGTYFATHRIEAWSFYSEEFPNVSLTTSPEPSLNPSPSPNTSRTSRNVAALATGLGVGGFVLVCGIVLFVMCRDREKMEVDECSEDNSNNFESGTAPKKYSYTELAIAANYFNDEQKLGQGGFGAVYKGFLKDSDSNVAIKRISQSSKQGKKEFASEVRIISQLRHRNLVQLIGWCQQRKELLLVYEYMPNGSLDSHLFKNQSLLIWSTRFKIAQGLASALLYLHEEWEQCVVHRDIKSSNIMLDSNFNAKLGDFGLARFVDHAKGSQTTAFAGTMGYLAPECVLNGRASKESDVYSFGVVVLEIACGRKSVNLKAPENEISIVRWVWQLFGSGKLLEAADSRLDGDFDHDQIKCLMTVGLWCAHPDHNHRPSIRQVIHVLNFESPSPSLPPSYPMPTYHEFPAWSSFSNLSGTNSLEAIKTICGA